MENPILYVILNKELKMSAGKAAAQTAHAVALLGDFNNKFIDTARRTVIVLEAENEAQIRSLNEYLFNVGLASFYYIDEGENEVPAYSVTAMAVEPFEADDKEKREVFNDFGLFNIRVDGQKESLDYLKHEAYMLQRFRDHVPRHIKKTIEWLQAKK